MADYANRGLGVHAGGRFRRLSARSAARISRRIEAFSGPLNPAPSHGESQPSEPPMISKRRADHSGARWRANCTSNAQ